MRPAISLKRLDTPPTPPGSARQARAHPPFPRSTPESPLAVFVEASRVIPPTESHVRVSCPLLHSAKKSRAAVRPPYSFSAVDENPANRRVEVPRAARRVPIICAGRDDRYSAEGPVLQT